MYLADFRARYPTEWTRWFAWFPVEVPGGYVWLAKVEYKWNRYPYHNLMGYIYRRILKDKPNETIVA